MTIKVFLSYSHSDTEFAHMLGEALRRVDYAVFQPDTGDMASLWYPDERRLYIEQSDAMVSILSAQIYHADSAWLREELREAEQLKKPIIPVLIEPIEYPREALSCWRSINFVDEDFRHAFRALRDQIYAVASPHALALRKLMKSRVRTLETETIVDPRPIRLGALIREGLIKLQIPPDQLDSTLAQLLNISERFAQGLLKGTFPITELDDDFLAALAEAVGVDPDDLRAIVNVDVVYTPPDSGRVQRPD